MYEFEKDMRWLRLIDGWFDRLGWAGGENKTEAG